MKTGELRIGDSQIAIYEAANGNVDIRIDNETIE